MKIVVPSLLTIFILFTACTPIEKKEKFPPTISAEEIARGIEGCERLIERLCECAKYDTEYAEQCQQHSPKVEVLKTYVLILEQAREGETEVKATNQMEIWRKTKRLMRGCFDDRAKIDPQRCTE